jgi:hypothetical protein
MGNQSTVLAKVDYTIRDRCYDFCNIFAKKSAKNWLIGKSYVSASKANPPQNLRFTPKFVGLFPGPYGGSLLQP